MLPDLVYLDASTNALEQIDLSASAKLVTLALKENRLKALDLVHNSEIGYLDCSKNELSHIDLSPLKKLVTLYCNNNKLATLSLTENALLGELACGENDLSSLDLSHNARLVSLSCYANKLEQLNLQENPQLKTIIVGNNALKQLDFSKNQMLQFVDCFANRIKDKDMTALMESLPMRTSADEAALYIIDGKDTNEQNICLDRDVKIAKEKNWQVYDYNGNYDDAIVYQGIGTSITPLAEVQIELAVDKVNQRVTLHTGAFTAISIYDVDGKLIAQNRANALGVAQWDYSGRVHSLYLIVVGDKTYKILL